MGWVEDIMHRRMELQWDMVGIHHNTQWVDDGPVEAWVLAVLLRWDSVEA
jgi:hypothetical protein